MENTCTQCKENCTGDASDCDSIKDTGLCLACRYPDQGYDEGPASDFIGTITKTGSAS